MQTIWNYLQGLDFQQRFYDAAGVRTRVIESGTSEKVLIFLHGTGGHAEAYLKNIASHSEHFRVMAIDMVGHGYTDAPDISYDMQCYVDFLLNFLDGIGVEKAYISGESLGATVAAWFAIAHPNRVEKVFRSANKRAGKAAWMLLFYALWHNGLTHAKTSDGDVFDSLSQTTMV